MFQFPPFAPAELVTCLQHAGLPHSEISGSKPVCSSPELVAAYHVLHRLQKPRHPPSALVTFSPYELMNHKNFRAYTCSHFYSLPWNCSPQLFDLTLYLSLKLQTSLISSNFTSLSFLKLVNELSVISQTGCKDTDFFLSSKFFCNIFCIFLHFSFLGRHNSLSINPLNITTNQQ